MRVLHPRPVHRRRRRGEGETGRRGDLSIPTPDSRLPIPDSQSPNHKTQNTKHKTAFTLIELIIVVLILLILMTLTAAVVGNMLDNSRVRGAARNIQNYLAGARDRAIYAASRSPENPPMVGVRFMADPDLVDASGDPLGYTSMVFVREIDPVAVNLRLWDDGTGNWHASQIHPTLAAMGNDGMVAVERLIERGLVGLDPSTGLYLLHVTVVEDDTHKDLYIKFAYPDTTYVNAAGWLINGNVSAPPPAGVIADNPTGCEFHLRPAPMPNEEPRLLPDNTIVELQSSVAGGAPRGAIPAPSSVRLNSGNSFDIMFNAQGVVGDRLAAMGLIHLVVADLADIERGFQVAVEDTATGNLEVGSPFLDADGDIVNGVTAPVEENGEPVVRQGDVRIVSLRTRTGSAYVSDLNPEYASNRFVDPYKYAETGGEAR